MTRLPFLASCLTSETKRKADYAQHRNRLRETAPYQRQSQQLCPTLFHWTPVTENEKMVLFNK